jgi:phosphatidylglycerol:prolipoprotein diacylglycerol transferase
MNTMTEVLSFPGLGFSITLNRVAFSIGNINVYWYGILIALGVALAIAYALKKA